MTSTSLSPRHTANEEWLASYSSGTLTPSKSLLIDCQMAIAPAIAAKINVYDEIGGAFIESAKGEDLSNDFLSRLSLALPDSDMPAHDLSATARDQSRGAGWIPSPLQKFLETSEIDLKWKKSAPGVERAPLLGEDGERLYLLKAKQGLKLPVHTHRGQEWTLILQGGYNVNGESYGVGDLHCEDENCVHQPIIDAHGEDCISLVVDEGALVFKNPIYKIIQPLLGV